MDTTNVWGLHPLGFSAKMNESNNYIVQYSQFDQGQYSLLTDMQIVLQYHLTENDLKDDYTL
jgi:hypothetical protein